jgi:hypothetical protein
MVGGDVGGQRYQGKNGGVQIGADGIPLKE